MSPLQLLAVVSLAYLICLCSITTARVLDNLPSDGSGTIVDGSRMSWRWRPGRIYSLFYATCSADTAASAQLDFSTSSCVPIIIYMFVLSQYPRNATKWFLFAEITTRMIDNLVDGRQTQWQSPELIGSCVMNIHSVVMHAIAVLME